MREKQKVEEDEIRKGPKQGGFLAKMSSLNRMPGMTAAGKKKKLIINVSKKKILKKRKRVLCEREREREGEIIAKSERQKEPAFLCSKPWLCYIVGAH